MTIPSLWAIHPLFGDRNRTEQFLTQWGLYRGVNMNNSMLANATQRAMLFLTYIQGTNINEWVLAMA